MLVFTPITLKYPPDSCFRLPVFLSFFQPSLQSLRSIAVTLACKLFNLLLNQYHLQLDADGAVRDQHPQIENICLFCDYIFLDKDEQLRFINEKKAYLIEQVQLNKLKTEKKK